MVIRDRFKNTNYKILSYHQNKIARYVIDETLIKVGSSEFIWLWVMIEPKDK